MYKQLRPIDLISAVQQAVESGTDKTCYDAVPENAPSPFYFAELVGIRAAPTKTMYRDIFTVQIHSIASEGASNVEVYKMIQELNEALTEDIVLPEGFDLLMQSSLGLLTIKTDETNERHAINEYEFTVCYGFKVKI